MRTLKLHSNSISEGTFRKVSKKYKNLSQPQRLELAPDFGMDLFMEEARKRVKEGKTTIVEFWDSKTNELVLKQKVLKKNGELLIDLETFKEGLQLNDKEIEDALSVIKGDRILESSEWFVHPLTERLEEDPNFVNMYGFATILINGIRNPSGVLDADPSKAEESLKHILLKLEPTLNVNKVIADIKMHRLSAMMKVSNIIGTGDISKLEKN